MAQTFLCLALHGWRVRVFDLDPMGGVTRSGTASQCALIRCPRSRAGTLPKILSRHHPSGEFVHATDLRHLVRTPFAELLELVGMIGLAFEKFFPKHREAMTPSEACHSPTQR